MTDFLFSPHNPAEIHINQWEGLKYYLETRPSPPIMPTTDAYLAMTPGERERFNRERQGYIVKGIRIPTRSNREAMKMYRRIRIGNIAGHSNSGLIIDGLFSTGKTTQCRLLMEQTFQRYLDTDPGYASHGNIPIVYIEAPPRSSGRALMIAMLRFYGGTVTPRDTTDTLLHKVITIILKAQTQLIVVDEFQNVADKNAGNGETIDYLKELTNAVPATFVLAGIDVVNSDVLTGRRGGQLLSRFIAHRTTSFPVDTHETAREWNGIVKGFENALPLYGQPPNSLVTLAPLLHTKTKGSIGSLAKLLRGAAIEAIQDAGKPSAETITRELIESWHVDVYAEHAPTPHTHTPAA